MYAILVWNNHFNSSHYHLIFGDGSKFRVQLAVWYQSFCTCNKLFPHIFTCFFLGLQEIDTFFVPCKKSGAFHYGRVKLPLGEIKVSFTPATKLLRSMEPGALEVVLSDFAPHEATEGNGEKGEKKQQTQEEMEGEKGKSFWLLIKRQIRVVFVYIWGGLSMGAVLRFRKEERNIFLFETNLAFWNFFCRQFINFLLNMSLQHFLWDLYRDLTPRRMGSKTWRPGHAGCCWKALFLCQRHFPAAAARRCWGQGRSDDRPRLWLLLVTREGWWDDMGFFWHV